MIAYFDTSALVPLLIDEAGTVAAGQIWDRAERLVSVRLARVEARAALAQAARLGRISSRQLRRSKLDLDDVLGQLELVEVDGTLVDRAADLAEQRSLRAYDAVHLAAAQRILSPDLVLVTGGRALRAAAHATGVAVANLG